MVVISFFFSLFSLTLAKVMRWTSNPYLIPPMQSGVTQYLVFHGQLALNSTLSRLRCQAMGGDLADVEDLSTFNYLHARLHSPAFVASFLGEIYNENCIAVYPGGAVAIPESGCGRLASICEIPIYGTHGIDLRSISIPSDPSAKIGKFDIHNNFTNASIFDDETLFRGLLVKSKHSLANGDDLHVNDKKLPRPGSITMVNLVTTVTIFGSIETDPALPCCKCCNPI
jgi:hypothetical protein